MFLLGFLCLGGGFLGLRFLGGGGASSGGKVLGSLLGRHGCHKGGDNTEEGTDCNHHDRSHAEAVHGHKGSQQQEQSPQILHRLLAEIPHGLGEECRHRHIDSRQGLLHQLDLGEVADEPGDDRDDDDGGGDDADSGHKGTKDSSLVEADEGGHVHGDDSWGGLADGVIVQHGFLGGPAPFFRQFLLQHGNHGIATTEGDGTNLEEDKKQFSQIRKLECSVFHR